MFPELQPEYSRSCTGVSRLRSLSPPTNTKSRSFVRSSWTYHVNSSTFAIILRTYTTGSWVVRPRCIFLTPEAISGALTEHVLASSLGSTIVEASMFHLHNHFPCHYVLIVQRILNIIDSCIRKPRMSSRSFVVFS